jgi:hypothetical protein
MYAVYFAFFDFLAKKKRSDIKIGKGKRKEVIGKINQRCK